MRTAEDKRDLEELSGLCPSGFMIGAGFRHSRPTRSETTYPSAWRTAYSEKHMVMCDPLIAWGLTNTGWIRWSEISERYADPLGVMQAAAEHGLAFGLGISIEAVGSRTLAGTARADRQFTDDEARNILALLTRIHLRSTNPPSLTAPQLEALSALSRGAPYDQICADLGISRTALRLRLERVRSALGVLRNKDAVRQARLFGILPSQPDLNSLSGAAFPPLPAQNRERA
ncbi:helix-turn-helix transcriptional regulator [Salipiger thiooxidans]|uniref:helix-turn-helix transcriptional regulator n=1 Tax=Salipiger thiooxidans TaxID=282683 RepID=UPI001CFAE63A|nr:autoinducer binding domain-containing protein [Salipiger thiooxidans]